MEKFEITIKFEAVGKVTADKVYQAVIRALYKANVEHFGADLAPR